MQTAGAEMRELIRLFCAFGVTVQPPSHEVKNPVAELRGF